jgi:hypothetical protein
MLSARTTCRRITGRPPRAMTRSRRALSQSQERCTGGRMHAPPPGPAMPRPQPAESAKSYSHAVSWGRASRPTRCCAGAQEPAACGMRKCACSVSIPACEARGRSRGRRTITREREHHGSAGARRRHCILCVHSRTSKLPAPHARCTGAPAFRLALPAARRCAR